jgi:plastocyanin
MSPVRLRTAILGGALLLAACTPSAGTPAASAAATTAPVAATPAASADVSASVQVLDFKLNPGSLSVTGTTLALSVTNAGPTVHNVTIRDAAGDVLFGSKDLREGESETVTHAIAPGTYVLFCSLPGHESLGVKGTLTVAAP